jgi:transcriptional regulator with XRE-family HTH domain
MNRIKEIRTSKRITQKQLSLLTGISQSYINELENNKKSNPSLAVLEKIASALRVQVSELLKDRTI